MAATRAFGQQLDGHASVMVDFFPDVEIGADGVASASVRRRVGELRTRVLVERRVDIGSRLRLTAAGFAEGLVAGRRSSAVTKAAIVRPQELHAELVWSRADIRIGLSRIVWGRLDEFLPTDVVNPLDLTRFFLEGRVEGRMPVGLVRARLLPSDRFTIEALYVPLFRRGRFDQLDEDTAPFNLVPLGTATIQEPRRTWSNAQGGVRANITTGRVDWSASAYRGFEPLPIYQLSLIPRLAMSLPIGRFPRFTMVGGDFETVRGAWGVRGEAAIFVERTLQAEGLPVAAEGKSFEAGVGVDRKAGDYRLSGNFVLARRTSRVVEDTDPLLVASLDRSFARETRHLRAFGAFNPADRSAFTRLIASFHLRDDVVLEASGGWFGGSGDDALSRLATRDFLYTRLKVSF